MIQNLTLILIRIPAPDSVLLLALLQTRSSGGSAADGMLRTVQGYVVSLSHIAHGLSKCTYACCFTQLHLTPSFPFHFHFRFTPKQKTD